VNGEIVERTGAVIGKPDGLEREQPVRTRNSFSYHSFWFNSRSWTPANLFGFDFVSRKSVMGDA